MTRLAAALALVAALLAGCSGSDDAPKPAKPSESASSSPAPTPEPAKSVPRPDVRACYALAYDEAVAPTNKRKPVDCADEHTAITFHVDALDAVVDGHLLAVDSEARPGPGRRRVPPAVR